MRRPPRGAKLKRTQAPPVRVSRALTRNVPWYVLAGMIFGLFRLTRLQAQEAERVALEKAAQERERAADRWHRIIKSQDHQILYQTVLYGV